MTEQIHVSAGLDLHKKFIIATLLTDTGFKEQRRFERTESGLFNLKEWTIEHKCEVVACESTSDFGVPIYTVPRCPIVTFEPFSNVIFWVVHVSFFSGKYLCTK